MATALAVSLGTLAVGLVVIAVFGAMTDMKRAFDAATLGWRLYQLLSALCISCATRVTARYAAMRSFDVGRWAMVSVMAMRGVRGWDGLPVLSRPCGRDGS